MWRPILMDKSPISVGTHHVNVRACGQVIRVARADLQIDRDRGASVLQVVTVSARLGEGGAIACAQHGFPLVLDQRQLSLKDVDKFILMAVPVPLARPIARWERHQVDAEVPQVARIAQSFARTPSARIVKRFRITCTNAYRNS